MTIILMTAQAGQYVLGIFHIHCQSRCYATQSLTITAELVVTLDATPHDDHTTENIIRHLLNEESRQSIITPVTPAVTPSVTKPDPGLTAKPPTPLKFITRFNCGCKGHYSEDCKALPAQVPLGKPSGSANIAVDTLEAAPPKYDGAW
ncbi:hypothetical protein C8Q80DRAFT_1118280 [Daedaleopsis nitida]|nr:hypothetical protein C8Q80DRAFT_1118280 [Daedaleopsis nitida]